MTVLKVLLVSSWRNQCGIAEYAGLLKASVEKADAIEVIPSVEALDPESDAIRSLFHDDHGIHLVHLNHHDALHSRWQPHHVERLMGEGGLPVLLTYHDTRERLEDCPKLAAMSRVCASTVVHEPVEGLKAIYWRQGVPAPSQTPARYHPAEHAYEWKDWAGMIYPRSDRWKAFPQQPVLGSVGFNFPWKNFTRLAEVTAREGWALLLIAHDATEADAARWKALNPWSLIVREFLPQARVVNALAGCDATAFMYECSNTGTSAAIRQGIAARKPVIALSGCRQFRDLLTLDYTADTRTGIHWVGDWEGLRESLRSITPLPWSPRISALATLDSWTQLGANYAQLYRMLVDQGGQS